jgi:transcriptional regulator with XRE-family HTH domain
MSDRISQLVSEVIDAAKAQGLKQKDLAERAGIGPEALSRLKTADDLRLSTLLQLGESVGKTLIWVDDTDDIATLVSKGNLF